MLMSFECRRHKDRVVAYACEYPHTISAYTHIHIYTYTRMCVRTSENHLENKACALISRSTPDEYLSQERTKTFWASALHRVVLPVPGGPLSNAMRFQDITLLSTSASEKATLVLQYRGEGG